MCYNPVIIANRRLDYYRALHPSALAVPCNECEDCVNLRRSDYATRTAFECQRFAVGNGGNAIMVLLTYNDEHVPYLPETDQMAFFRPHIKLLNDMLRAYFFSDSANPKFAYLIGAEYGVDERFTQRPHYHGLYVLDASIDPHLFMSVIRQIWQGQLSQIYQASHKHTYKWVFGNLGLVLPFEHDTEHDYIVKDAASASLYCAKYAVKQVGFYNKPALQYVMSHNLKHRYLKFFPKVWTSRGYGKSMINDATFDIVAQQVVNPYTKRAVSIPRAVQEMYMYDKVDRGTRHIIYDPESHEAVLKRDGTPRTRKEYDRVYKPYAIPVRLAQLDRMIDNYRDKLNSLGCIDSIAYQLAVYHYVFARVPMAVVVSRFGWSDNLAYYTAKYKEIYTYVKLQRFKLTSALDAGYKPLYKYKYTEYLHTSDVLVQSGDEVTFDCLLSHDMMSLYNHFTSLAADLQNSQSKLRDQKFADSQLLRHLLKPHPLK